MSATKGNQVKRYEGLFILNTTAKEEGVKDTIDKISAEIATAGGKLRPCKKWTSALSRAWPTKSTAPASS